MFDFINPYKWYLVAGIAAAIALVIGMQQLRIAWLKTDLEVYKGQLKITENNLAMAKAETLTLKRNLAAVNSHVKRMQNNQKWADQVLEEVSQIVKTGDRIDDKEKADKTGIDVYNDIVDHFNGMCNDTAGTRDKADLSSPKQTDTD